MRIVILGAGPIGLALAEEALRRSHEVVLVSRTQPSEPSLLQQVQFRQADLLDPAALPPLLSGANLIVHALGVSFAKWESDLPVLVNNTLAAAAEASLPLLYCDSLDAVGDNGGVPISESSPERPNGPRALLRSHLAQQVTQARSAHKLTTTIARFCDVFGQRVLKGPFGDRLFGAALADKKVELLGESDTPHSIVYVKDVARSLCTLIENSDAWNRTWHLPAPAPITQKQMVDILRSVLNRNVAWTVKKPGFFAPELKEWTEAMYRFEKPFVINFSRFSTTFGERVQPHEQSFSETMEWFRKRVGIERRYGF